MRRVFLAVFLSVSSVWIECASAETIGETCAKLSRAQINQNEFLKIICDDAPKMQQREDARRDAVRKSIGDEVEKTYRAGLRQYKRTRVRPDDCDNPRKVMVDFYLQAQCDAATDAERKAARRR